jgi:hypothetical protein
VVGEAAAMQPLHSLPLAVVVILLLLMRDVRIGDSAGGCLVVDVRSNVWDESCAVDLEFSPAGLYK